MKIMTDMILKVAALTLMLLVGMTPALAEQKGGITDPCPIKIENWRGKAFYEILFMNREANGSADSSTDRVTDCHPDCYTYRESDGSAKREPDVIADYIPDDSYPRGRPQRRRHHRQTRQHC